MEKDWNAQGEKDGARSSSRTSTVDIVSDQIFGGSYNPPSDKSSRDSYDAGFSNNSSQNKSK